MSIMFALLLAIGPVAVSYVQASQWEVVIEQQAKAAEHSSEEEEVNLLQGHSFHAVITAGVSILQPAFLPSPVPSNNPLLALPRFFQPPSLCIPSLLEYYCNIRQYCIAPHAP